MRNGKVGFVAALLLLASTAGRCAEDNEQLLVVSTSALTHYWAVDHRAMPESRSVLVVAGINESSAGCINVGFFIETDGKANSQRILKEALSGRSPRANDVIGLGLIAFAPSVQKDKVVVGSGALAYTESDRVTGFLHYEASEENLGHSRVFTSFPFVFMSRSIAKRLIEPDRSKFVDALRSSCDIADLGSWVKEHGVAKPVVVPGPDLPALSSN